MNQATRSLLAMTLRPLHMSSGALLAIASSAAVWAFHPDTPQKWAFLVAPVLVSACIAGDIVIFRKLIAEALALPLRDPQTPFDPAAPAVTVEVHQRQVRLHLWLASGWVWLLAVAPLSLSAVTFAGQRVR
jgi:hypothetical protein